VLEEKAAPVGAAFVSAIFTRLDEMLSIKMPKSIGMGFWIAGEELMAFAAVPTTLPDCIIKTPLLPAGRRLSKTVPKAAIAMMRLNFIILLSSTKINLKSFVSMQELHMDNRRNP
jgi:hypothetical protein